MFLTPEQTGGPSIFSMRRGNHYLAVEVREFDIDDLAVALGRGAGDTWQEHASLILEACTGGKLFAWLERLEDGK